MVPLVREARGELDQARTLVAEIKELVSSLPTASPRGQGSDCAHARAPGCADRWQVRRRHRPFCAIVSLYPEDAGQIQQAVSKLSSIEKMLGSTASSLDAMLADDGAQIRALAEGRSAQERGTERGLSRSRRANVAWMPNAPVPSAAQVSSTPPVSR